MYIIIKMNMWYVLIYLSPFQEARGFNLLNSASASMCTSKSITILLCKFTNLIIAFT